MSLVSWRKERQASVSGEDKWGSVRRNEGCERWQGQARGPVRVCSRVWMLALCDGESLRFSVGD